MFRQIGMVALAVLVAVGGIAVVTAEEPKVKSPPKELNVDLGKGVKVEMVLIPAGEFLMGSPDSEKDSKDHEKPQHRVRITKPFYLGKYLVTQEQWEAVMGSNPSHFKGPKSPVETVSWDDCQEFLGKLNTKSVAGGGKFQLPSEAQWEYACRAGSKTRYCFGDDVSKLGEYAWYDGNSDNTTHAVGEKKPNGWGLYDMHGNVWEWCQDWWKDGYYKESPLDDPTGAATGSYRVVRGGCWGHPAMFCRSALGYGDLPGLRDVSLGLRVSRVLAVGPGGETNSSPKQLRVDVKEPQPSEQGKTTQTAGTGGKTDSWPKELTVDLGKGVKLEMVLIPAGEIPAGEFPMGSPDSDKDAYPDEKPQHRVRITKPFYLGKYLVTQEQWETVMGNNPSRFKGPRNPVETVGWEDCQKFLGRLNAKSSRGAGKFQLPSEAQWEYACRAGSKTRYCFGDDEKQLGEYAWYDGNSGNTTHPVGENKPNAWGLYDMHGNVFEWCQDWWKDGYYKESPVDDPTGPTGGSYRVFRGGSWYDPAWFCRSAIRFPLEPGSRFDNLGLRVSRVPADK